MSELETRRAAFEPENHHPENHHPENNHPENHREAALQDPDVIHTAELVQYEDADADAQLEHADADLLAIPPRADDLGTALAARPPRAKLPKVTVALASAALVCAGFIGGVLVQKHLGGNSASGGRGNFGSAFTAGRTGTGGFFGRGGGAGGSGGGGGGAGGGAITGTVTVVSGDKLYVTAPDGSVYTVSTTGSTVVNVTQSGTLSQLKPGQTVVVAGSNDNKGDVTATSITAGGATPSTSGKSTGGQ